MLGLAVKSASRRDAQLVLVCIRFCYFVILMPFVRISLLVVVTLMNCCHYFSLIYNNLFSIKGRAYWL